MNRARPVPRGAELTFTYWKSLPKTGLLPDRAAFDPVKVAYIMPDLLMIEFGPAEEARFRFAGTRVTDHLGFDPTRRAYLEVLVPEAFDQYLEASRAVFSTPCVGRFSITAQAASGFVLRFDVLDLPMRNKATGTMLILAHVTLLETVGYTGVNQFMIQSIEPLGWYDIGAGKPPGATAC